MSMVLHRRRRGLGLAAAILWALALVSPVAAATCTEEIALLAQQYGLAGAPRLEAPFGTADRGGAWQSTPLSETKRAQMEALLNAAKAAEQQRQTAACFARLSDARAIPEPG